MQGIVSHGEEQMELALREKETEIIAELLWSRLCCLWPDLCVGSPLCWLLVTLLSSLNSYQLHTKWYR